MQLFWNYKVLWVKSNKLEAAKITDIHSDIIEKCKKGDRTAQFKLYNLYKKAMYNVSLRIVNSTDEAEDILQESFLSAFQNMESYEGRSTFGAWLKRIVINKALSNLKSRKVAFDSIDERHDLADDEIPINEDEIDFKVWKIKTALKNLPDGFRTVLSLYLFEGYDHKEIASILNITESTSKSQFLRAKRKLLEVMKMNDNG